MLCLPTKPGQAVIVMAIVIVRSSYHFWPVFPFVPKFFLVVFTFGVLLLHNIFPMKISSRPVVSLVAYMQYAMWHERAVEKERERETEQKHTSVCSVLSHSNRYTHVKIYLLMNANFSWALNTEYTQFTHPIHRIQSAHQTKLFKLKHIIPHMNLKWKVIFSLFI